MTLALERSATRLRMTEADFDDWRHEHRRADGRLNSVAIPGFWLKTDWLWRTPPPGALACLREMGLLA